MNWFNILKEQRHIARNIQSFKPIQLDKPIKLNKPEKDCYEKLIEYIESCGFTNRLEYFRSVRFYDKENVVVLRNVKELKSQHLESFCPILEDLKQIKILETKDAKKAILPNKDTASFLRTSEQHLTMVEVNYVKDDYLLHVFIKG